MTKQEKSDLQWKVRFLLGDGQPNTKIVEILSKMGFQKSTIKQYIKAFTK